MQLNQDIVYRKIICIYTSTIYFWNIGAKIIMSFDALTLFLGIPAITIILFVSICCVFSGCKKCQN